MSLSGKVAIVTGGSKGIGKAVAIGLAAAGAKVVIAGRNESFLIETSQEIENTGGKCIYFTGDISITDDATRLVKLALDTFGGLDILINNAGVGAFGAVDSFLTADYDRIMDTNVKGTFVMSKEVIPVFKENKSGHIVMIASDVSRRVFENGSVYCASKHAQLALADGIRKEVRSFGIRVGVVLPGLTDTYFNDTQQGEPQKHGWLKASDIASAVMYMLNAPPQVVIDEITLHPLVQQDY